MENERAMTSFNRRDFLTRSGQGFGALALAAMLAQDEAVAETNGVGRGGVLKALHHPPRAKRVVQLFMGGAASHIDLFDYKPELEKHHGEPSDFWRICRGVSDWVGAVDEVAVSVSEVRRVRQGDQ